MKDRKKFEEKLFDLMKIVCFVILRERQVSFLCIKCSNCFHFNKKFFCSSHRTSDISELFFFLILQCQDLRRTQAQELEKNSYVEKEEKILNL